MTDMVRKFAGPTGFTLSRFFPERTVDSETITWDVKRYTRSSSVYVDKNAPSIQVPKQPLETKSSILARIALHDELDQIFLLYERTPGQFMANEMEQKLADAQFNLVRTIDIQREEAYAQILTTGKLNLTLQSGKVIDIDYNIPATHKVVTAKSWSDPTATIIDDVRTWKRLLGADSNETPTDVLCSEAVMGYLMKNNEVKSFIGDSMKDQVRETGYITRLLGLNFEVNESGREVNGVFTRFIPDNVIIMTTQPGTFGRMYLGPELVKTGPDSFEKVLGRWSYAVVEHDPVRKILYVGEQHLPVLTSVDNILIATVIL
jgi:hypothetical protein